MHSLASGRRRKGTTEGVIRIGSERGTGFDYLSIWNCSTALAAVALRFGLGVA